MLKKKLNVFEILIITAILFVSFFPQKVVLANEAYYFAEDDDSWIVKTLEARGLDSNIIEEMYDYILDNEQVIQSILISRDGYLIQDEYLYAYERTGDNFYYNPYDDMLLDQIHENRHHVWSVTKSITSLLVGIAIDLGDLDNVTQKFFDIFPDKWKPIYQNETKKDITIEDLLTMTSGLSWNEAVDAFEIWPGTGYSLDYILNKTLVHDPGTTFTYSTGNTELLAAILQNRTGVKLANYAKQYLFDPIGVDENDIEWIEDTWEWGSGALTTISHGGFGIFAAPRALARIGELCLNNGNWNGTQVIPAEWIENATTTHSIPIGVGEGLEYGYLFWLDDDFYSAIGALGQQISIIPKLDTVVVITSELLDLASNTPTYLVKNYIIQAALVENLTIAKPLNNAGYGANSPYFEIYPEKPYRNGTWYSLNSGINTTFTEFSGVINPTQWDILSTGNYSLTFYANNSAGEIISKTVNIIKDVIDPIIIVNFTGNTFGKIAPDFTVSITEDYLNDTWYTLDDGNTNITFTGLSGTIDQDQWDNVAKGEVTIVFYARDITGNIGSHQIILQKVIPSEIIPGYSLLLLLGVFSITVVLIARKLKIRFK
ncbi:MAG: serine hydrolase domain-containing protein [Candidatus Hodarchaeota archaeon]